MWIEEMRDFFSNLDFCEICILRYKNTDFITFESSLKTLEITQKDNRKRQKSNVCFACLGIFQENVANEIVTNSNLCMYECNSIYSSISVPITILIHELSIWIELIRKFPENITDDSSPCISVKEVFKNLLNNKLCEATNRKLEHNQNGILVNVIFDCESEPAKIERLLKVKPKTLNTLCRNRQYRKNVNIITRNLFEKHYYPKNLDLDEFRNHLPLSCETISSPIKFACTINGPTIFIAGRYRKLSRDISQTPWIIDGKRMKNDSVQEIISGGIAPYFQVDSDGSVFMGSGREDVDVRCLGKGRPFVLQISDAKKSIFPKEIAAQMELSVADTKLVSVQHLQLVKREELVHIKAGEEHKKKFYRALCSMKSIVTSEIIEKLNIPKGFLIQQRTPLRVLHRRPLLTRPRQIFYVKGFICKEHQNVIILDVATQAGTYVKELIHGDFGRTSPSISSIIGENLDIVALDVTAIDLDWPCEKNNQSHGFSSN